jgi:hypothetical protein
MIGAAEMNEFVERVAKAISRSDIQGIPLEHNNKMYWMELARAAIAAMEPTPEMIEAGMKLVGTEDFIKQDIEEIWNTMCAEALK